MNNNKGIIGIGLIIAIVLGIVVVGGGAYYLGKSSDAKKEVNNIPLNWNQYSNKYYSDYSINYPNDLIVSEYGKDNRKATISTKDYSTNMVNGAIKSGFIVDLSVNYFDSFDKLFSCNKEEMKNIQDNCLLVRSETHLVNYTKGEVKTEPIVVNGNPGFKYEFISNEGGNNNIGIVVKKGDKYYVALVAYRDDKNIELFNQILSSFNFLNIENKINKIQINNFDSWETYMTSSMGFELKYPPSIENMDYISGFRGPTEVLYTIDDSAKTDVSRMQGSAVVRSTKIDGQDARIVCSTKEDYCSVSILLPKPLEQISNSGKYFKVLVLSALPSKYIDQIISSFKFIK